MATVYFSHYAEKANGLIVFNLDSCEFCGTPVQEPNAMTAQDSAQQREKLDRAGLEFLPEAPQEVFHDEDLGGAACTSCISA